jgi:hypothetical protein
MNLRRGLFRLWIVGAALFVLAVAFVNYDEIEDWASLGRVAAFAFSIPLAILGFGTALAWALTGFDTERQP